MWAVDPREMLKKMSCIVIVFEIIMLFEAKTDVQKDAVFILYWQLPNI